MRKLIIMLILLFPFSVFAINAQQKSLNGVTYYEYVPSGAGSNTRVVFAFHGIGATSNDLTAFGMTKVLDTNPSCVIVIPSKQYGSWNISTYSSFITSYISSNPYKGPVSYYGFSQGALDGPKIIASAGVFSNAVFVDEDFINYTGGVDATYNKISGLSSVKVYCGKFCDSASNLNSLKSKFESAGKRYEIDSNPTYEHGTMNTYAASPGLNFLNGSGSTGTGNSTAGGSSGGGSNTSSGGVTTTASGNSNAGSANKTATRDFSLGGCPLGEEVTKDLSGALKVMKIFAPIFVLVYTIFDAIVAIVKGDVEAEGKKMLSKFLKRIAAALTMFAIPTLIDVLMQLFNIWDNTGHCSFSEAVNLLFIFK